MPLKVHGDNPKGNPSKEYRSWVAMKKRCTYEKHPHFKKYSTLGLDPNWAASYPAFLADVGRSPSARHTLDRVDTTKGYFPGNVQWATPKEQGRNRVDSVFIDVGDVPININAACERYGLKRTTIRQRILRGLIGRDLIAPVGTLGRWKTA